MTRINQTECFETGAGSARGRTVRIGIYRIPRGGLSVIEVLTAIVVALIGLSGVLIMIPFAVSQAEIGMDTEKAVNLARNATEELVVRRVLETPPVVTSDPVTGGPVPPPPAWILQTGAVARCYCLDPAGVADRFESGLRNAMPPSSGVFPFIDPAAELLIRNSLAPPLPGTINATAGIKNHDQTVLVQRASVADLASLNAAVPFVAPVRRSLANDLVGWHDDLQSRAMTEAEFADTVTFNAGNQYLSRDLALPIPQMDTSVSTAGVRMEARMQSLGEVSWAVVTCPATISPQIAVDPGTSIPFPPAAPETGNYPVNPDTQASDIVSETRNFFMVYKRRPLPVLAMDAATGFPLAEQAFDRVYSVYWPGFPNDVPNRLTGLSDPHFRNSANGGTLQLIQPAPLAASNVNSKQRYDIRRGDWMALTNVIFDVATSRFVQQYNFYQVTDAFLDDNATPALGDDVWHVSLEGPDWDFGMGYEVDPMLGIVLDENNPMALRPPFPPDNLFAAQVIGAARPRFEPSHTMAIHLPDVWTVFERTVRISD